jgi:hypothetical protein
MIIQKYGVHTNINKPTMIKFSLLFNPIILGIITAVGGFIHLRYTADLITNITNVFISYIVSPSLLFILLLSLSFFTAKYLKITDIGMNAMNTTIGLVLSYTPILFIVLYVFYFPV